ncbi:MAG: SMP-30/gluconolactonase/LRE family protein [Aeromicrobium sp.]
MSEVVPVTEPRFTLAEGPVWDAARERILWVDIIEGTVLVGRLSGDGIEIEAEHDFETYVGTTVPATDGSLLVAGTRTLTRLDPDGTRRTSAPEPSVGPRDRFNDGICDAQGRLLIGTLSLPKDHRDQRLLQVDGSSVRVLEDDLGLANGMAFSPDDSLLYTVDSVPGRVWVRSYDHATGAPGERELLIDLPDVTPDGMCVDAEGHLWIAIWGGGQVRRYSPAGDLVDVIELPAPHVTSVAFVGPALDRLVVTTARSELSDTQLGAHPLSGALFLTRPGVSGLPTHPWNGTLAAPSPTGAAR